MNYPDVSEVLRGDVLIHEDDTWVRLIRDKQRLAESLRDISFKNVLEIGCGTGLYAGILTTLYPDIGYLGVDSNPEALIIARRRNPTLTFIRSDFRELQSSLSYDLVCAHAFLKHFDFENWTELFPKFLSLGHVAQFDMQTAAETINDGSPTFGNNLWVSRPMLDLLLEDADHKIISEEIAYEHADRRATIFITSRV